MEKTYSCCWERTDWGEVLPGYPRHWGLSVLMPQSGSAYLCKWKKWSPGGSKWLTSPSLGKRCQCHLGFILNYFREWGAQSPSVAKGKQLLSGSEGIPSESSSELLQLWISPHQSILPHWLEWVSAETNPTRMQLLFFTISLPHSFQTIFFPF